jgi:hypothetical protein
MMDYGATAGRKVAGVQAANFARQAERVLVDVPVGPQKQFLDSVRPECISAQRGAIFTRDPNIAPDAGGGVAPEGITAAVLQNHPFHGPRVLLLDADRMAQATIPVSNLQEGSNMINRMGFQALNPVTDTKTAQQLAIQMSRADKVINTSYGEYLAAKAGDFTDLDFMALAFADNPGRLAIVNGIKRESLEIPVKRKVKEPGMLVQMSEANDELLDLVPQDMLHFIGKAEHLAKKSVSVDVKDVYNTPQYKAEFYTDLYIRLKNAGVEVPPLPPVITQYRRLAQERPD